MADTIIELRDQGLSLRAVADRLETDDIPTVTGRGEWRAASVSKIERRRRAQLEPTDTTTVTEHAELELA